MTPGAAKSRQELFYLPYPEPNRVLINAHNFTPPFTGSVNGKQPIACWCPSRDTLGNGTTTLTDFAGTNNGTLTNMDQSTDWVTDTVAGGVRALDFDGVNDVVLPSVMSSINGISRLSISLWVKRNVLNAFGGVYQVSSSGAGNGRTQIGMWNDGRMYCSVEPSGANAFGSFATNDLNWHHAVLVFDGTLAGNANRAKIYFDGSQQTLTFFGTIPSTTNSANTHEMGIGAAFFVTRLHGAVRIDDVRVFTQALNLADITAMWASGIGRGVQS